MRDKWPAPSEHRRRTAERPGSARCCTATTLQSEQVRITYDPWHWRDSNKTNRQGSAIGIENTPGSRSGECLRAGGKPLQIQRTRSWTVDCIAQIAECRIVLCNVTRMCISETMLVVFNEKVVGEIVVVEIQGLGDGGGKAWHGGVERNSAATNDTPLLPALPTTAGQVQRCRNICTFLEPFPTGHLCLNKSSMQTGKSR